MNSSRTCPVPTPAQVPGAALRQTGRLIIQGSRLATAADDPDADNRDHSDDNAASANVAPVARKETLYFTQGRVNGGEDQE